MSPIVTLQRRLAEVGRIRLGARKGNRPTKLDTFRLTSASAELLATAAELYGGEVKPWDDNKFELFTEVDTLDIVIPPGQSLSSWMEMWTGGGCQRRCDGVRQVLRDVPCSCPDETDERMELAAQGKACKPTTRLNVILPNVRGMGVWRLESHGYYAATELAGIAEVLERATRKGQLIPAKLRLDKRTVKKAGRPPNHFVVPMIDAEGTFGEMLEAIGAIGPGGAMSPPIERKQLPGSSPGLPTDPTFSIERQESGAVEEASMPGGPPPPVPQVDVPPTVEDLVSAFGEQRVVVVAESYRQELGRGNPITGIGGLAKATPDIMREISRRLDGEVVEAEVVEQGGPAVDHPCPECGAECTSVTQVVGKKRPKWKCTFCEWASWQNEPWNPDKPNRDGLKDSDANAPASDASQDPRPADASADGEGSDPGPALPSDAELINLALDNKQISWADVCKASISSAKHFPGIDLPGQRRSKKYFDDKPEFASAVVYALELRERLPV